jgi:site-specific recombinase XerD
MGIGIGQNWRFAIFTGISGYSPIPRLRLRDPEIERLLEVAQTPFLSQDLTLSPTLERSDEECARDFAILLIMLEGGLFIEEIVALRTCAIEQNSRKPAIAFIRYDRRPQRQKLLSNQSIMATKQYLLMRKAPARANVSLFLTCPQQNGRRRPLTSSSLWSRLRRLMMAAEVDRDRITPYALRNSFAKRFIDGGGDLRELGTILGITDFRATENYVSDLQSKMINYEVGEEW